MEETNTPPLEQVSCNLVQLPWEGPPFGVAAPSEQGAWNFVQLPWEGTPFGVTAPSEQVPWNFVQVQDLITANITDQDPRTDPLGWWWYMIRKIASILTDTCVELLESGTKDPCLVQWPRSTTEGFEIRINRLMILIFDYPEDRSHWDKKMVETCTRVCRWYRSLMLSAQEDLPYLNRSGRSTLDQTSVFMTYDQLYCRIRDRFGPILDPPPSSGW
jgi:hypothetical protein